MGYQIAFYIHHHGSGHIMRALSMAKAFTDKGVTFLGSNLSAYQSLIPDKIECISLPLDVALTNEINEENKEQCRNFLYAPLNRSGVRRRNQILTNFFALHHPLLFIVDTSPEIVALGRLCSVPTIMVQQHGHRNDLPHQLAYDNAVKIIAPFPEEIAPDSPGWLKEKTIYAGGFSRFDSSLKNKAPGKVVGILVGSGGTSLDVNFIYHLANEVPEQFFKAIGNIDLTHDEKQNRPHNLQFMGVVEDPREELEACCLIIGNAGHNTVMEVATLDKRFICIPEQRPFFEQFDKAEKIQREYGVKVIFPDQLYNTDWKALITGSLKDPADWKNLIRPEATRVIRNQLDQLAERVFNLS